jgi:hypothetical protein
MGVSVQDANRVGAQDARYPATSVLYTQQWQHFGILRGARSHQLRGSFNKQNDNFEKSQELMGQSEKFKNQ